MIADISEIKKKLLPRIAAHGVDAGDQDVTIEADQDEYGYDFLRILIRLRTTEHPDDARLEELLESIESAVEAIDERSVSVRFDEAA